MRSRTSQSIKNTKIALVFYFIELIAKFFSRKIFLDYLGSEVLGLNTTAQSLVGVLNIAELGIGMSVAYHLYKPIYEGNQKEINDIVSVQGWLYRRIAGIVIACSMVSVLFFPLVFAKANVPQWYTYGSFAAFLTGSLLDYFVNYRLIVLSADQKEYKITFCTKGGMVLKILLQVLAIRYLEYGYESWLAIELASAFIISIALNRTIGKEYPWLKPMVKDGNRLRKQYPDIILKTRQLFYHKIAECVLFQTGMIVVYAYESLSIVACYGNYMMIVNAIASLVNAMFNGLNAGIGNLVAEGDLKKIKSVFWKITFVRMWITAIVCFVLYLFGDQFVSMWVGSEYSIPQSAFMILVLNTFISLSRANDMFLAAYGLFSDIWAPVMEALLNLGLSILFGSFWGLTGILSGIFVSLFVIVCCWKPYFLYKRGFKERFSGYAYRYVKYLSVLAGSAFLCKFVLHSFVGGSEVSYMQFGVHCVAALCLFTVCSLSLLCVADKYPRMFIRENLIVKND